MIFENYPLLTPLAFSAAGAIAVALIGGLLTKIDSWYRNLRKPWWNPPDWAFGPIWTVILALAAYSIALAWQAAPQGLAKWAIIGAVLFNAVFHVLWSALFFRLRRPDWAMADVALLWLSILAMILVFGEYSATSGLLLGPYLAWVSIAAFLNYEIVRLNGPFGTRRWQ